MTAYVISELSEINPNYIGEYLARAYPSIEAYGGRYLTSTTDIFVAEGNEKPIRYVIVEFSSMERAREWYSSEAYSHALEVRDKALVRRLMIINGRLD